MITNVDTLVGDWEQENDPSLHGPALHYLEN